VFDATGRIIASKCSECCSAESLEFNITSSPAGMYLVKADFNGTVETARLVKIN
jgi:hypothetical protein